MSFSDCSAGVLFHNVKVTDPFWTGRIDAIKSGSLPAMYDQMKQTGRWDAFKLQWKPGDPNPPHRFWDSDVAKWLEAACYVQTVEPNATLGSQIEEAVDLIRGAQQEDGYINTYYTVVEPGKRWTNLSWSHELYDAGHLLEAALAHHTYSHSRRLLAPLLKYIDYINSVFGPLEEQKAGYPGHQELELALLKGYEQLGDDSMLELASYFIEERGQLRPEGHYFDVEAKARGEPPNPGPSPKGAPKYSYHQADRPVREIQNIEGHSVRAMYWLTAVAQLARHTKDQSLLNVAERLWESSTKRKMYVTGGLGSMSEWEGFGPDFVLPNETGYLETCASIGLLFFAYQMLLIQPHKAEYADVLELALYNAVLVGVSLDGKRFFYENPLATVGKLYERSAWFDCSCCPPNVARLLTTLGKYIFSVGSDDTIFIHLYVSCSAALQLPSGKQVTVIMEANGPWQGGATIRAFGSGAEGLRFNLRKPLGANEFKVCTNEGISMTTLGPDGRIETRTTNHGTVNIDFKYDARIIKPHPLTLENRGCIAFARGPFVYCAESVDNPAVSDLRKLRIVQDSPIHEVLDDHSFQNWGIKPVVLKVAASVVEEYGTKCTVTLIPVFLWANRGKSDLRVWLAAE